MTQMHGELNLQSLQLHVLATLLPNYKVSAAHTDVAIVLHHIGQDEMEQTLRFYTSMV